METKPSDEENEDIKKEQLDTEEEDLVLENHDMIEPHKPDDSPT